MKNKTPFRESKLDIDKLIQERDKAKSDLVDVKKELSAVRRANAVKKATYLFWRSFGVIIGLAVVLGVGATIKSCKKDRESKIAASAEAESKVFEAAEAWIKKHNGGKGEAWCWIQTAKGDNGYLEPTSLVLCHVRYATRQDGPDRYFHCSAAGETCYEERESSP